ncbi:MSCRAMM family protein [Pyxidicoccus trucidator]|uniref:MSCRAMM family protein n=1 Tax=Pyxidicoccus trucidator TaxID=2709662 RepID=UPI0013D9F061|nr:carboxypeptidase regulatory-like domain-containing protein [Pyxidicoccus trucidator]
MRTRHWLWGSVVVGALVLVTWALPGGGWRGAPSSKTQAVRNAGTPHASRAAATTSQRPSAGLRISGTVVDTEGVPVAGVRVSASSPEPGQTLSELPCPEGSQEPYEDPRDPSTHGRTLPECVEPARALIMELVGAREGEASIHAETTTGADGAFVLEGLPEGPMALWALDARGAGMRSGIPAGSEGVELVLDKGMTVRGTATGEDAPIADVRVTVLDLRHPRFFDATSGPDGRFELGPLPEGGTYYGLVAKEGWLPQLLPLHAIHLGMTLHRPSRLAGRVLADGVPVPGAEVRMAPDGHIPSDGARGLTTDAAGRFTWTLPPGEYTLSAAHEGRYALARVTVGTASPEVALELGTALHVEGTVSDELGRPVAGATVDAVHREASNTRLRAVTNERGHYGVGPVEPGTWGFTAEAPGHVDLQRAEERTLGPNPRPVDLTLKRAASVTGRVTDTGGRPLPGIELAFGRVYQREDVIEYSFSPEKTWTDAEGRFVLDAEEPGDYLLEAPDAPFLEASFPVRAPSRDVHLTLEPGASVEGTVVDAQGLLLEGFFVELQDPKGEEVLHVRRGVRTDTKGHFLLRGVPPGRYVLLATREQPSATRRVWRVVELSAGARMQVELRMEPERTLSGLVVDEAGQPAAGAIVRARPPQRGGPVWKRDGFRSRHGPPPGLPTGEDGRFILHGLTEATYDVSAGKPGYTLAPERSTGGTAGEGDMLRVGAETAEVRLVLTRDAHVVGRLVGPDGAPIPRFRVSGMPFNDERGAFALPIDSLPSDELLFEAEGVAARVLRWERHAGGGDVDVGVVRMRRGRDLRGRLVDAETGKPLAHANLDLASRASHPELGPLTVYSQGTGEDGTFELSDLDLEAFTVTATAEGYRKQRLTVGPEQEEVTVRMDPGARVEVTVKDLEGRPRTARVEFQGDNDAVLSGLADKGHFVQRGLKPGPYTVRLSAEDSLDRRFPVFHPQRVVVPPSGRLPITFQATAGGATVKLRVAGGTSAVVILFSGSAPPPTRLEDVGSLFAHSLTVEQPEDEATFRQVPPGRATVFVLHPDSPTRVHREELDIPTGGTLSRELSPVWRSFAADSD